MFFISRSYTRVGYALRVDPSTVPSFCGYRLTVKFGRIDVEIRVRTETALVVSLKLESKPCAFFFFKFTTNPHGDHVEERSSENVFKLFVRLA